MGGARGEKDMWECGLEPVPLIPDRGMRDRISFAIGNGETSCVLPGAECSISASPCDDWHWGNT